MVADAGTLPPDAAARLPEPSPARSLALHPDVERARAIAASGRLSRRLQAGPSCEGGGIRVPRPPPPNRRPSR